MHSFSRLEFLIFGQNAARIMLVKLTTAIWSQSYQTFYSPFFFFGVKLGHFIANNFFSVCNKNASLPAKNGKILRQRRKKVWQDRLISLRTNSLSLLLKRHGHFVHTSDRRKMNNRRNIFQLQQFFLFSLLRLNEKEKQQICRFSKYSRDSVKMYAGIQPVS